MYTHLDLKVLHDEGQQFCGLLPFLGTLPTLPYALQTTAIEPLHFVLLKLHRTQVEHRLAITIYTPGARRGDGRVQLDDPQCCFLPSPFQPQIGCHTVIHAPHLPLISRFRLLQTVHRPILYTLHFFPQSLFLLFRVRPRTTALLKPALARW